VNREEMEDLRLLLRNVLEKITDPRFEDFNKSITADAGCRDFSVHTAMLIYYLNKRIAGF
jgi:hypothetical protein